MATEAFGQGHGAPGVRAPRENAEFFTAVARDEVFGAYGFGEHARDGPEHRVTGRMYGMTAAVNDNHIFAGGYLKSTLDPEAPDFVESPADYAVTGPYTTSDWDGTNAKTITVDLQLARTRRYSSSTVSLAATYWPDRWLAP